MQRSTLGTPLGMPSRHAQVGTHTAPECHTGPLRRPCAWGRGLLVCHAHCCMSISNSACSLGDMPACCCCRCSSCLACL